MAKKDATRRQKRQSKVVEDEDITTEGQSETVVFSEQIRETEEDNLTESTEVGMNQEDRHEQDSQINTDIEVRGNTRSVTVSWRKKKREGEGDDTEKTNASDEMMGSADAVGSTQEAPTQTADTEVEQEMEQCGDKQESQMDTVAEDDERTPAVSVTWKETTEKTNGSEQMTVKETQVKGKRKAAPATETSPAKKTKVINNGFHLFVGNLNSSKTFEEVKDSVANYLMSQSLLFKDVQLDRSRKHAFVEMASEMDLTKALKLNGEIILEKPIKIAKAKIKSEDKVKVKAPPLDKKVKDGRCLFLKNVPYSATKKDILKLFHKAITVRFPGGTEGPSHGIAFVEFRNKITAKKVLQRKQGAKLQGRVLIVAGVGETELPAATKANADKKSRKEIPPTNTLFVKNLSYNVDEKKLRNVFQKAVSISIPQIKGKPKGFAFVEFATVADAEKALQSSQNIKICKRAIRVQFSEAREMSEDAKVQSKTLIIMGLDEKTTAETLKSAFEGSLSARVILDKETGVSKRFGFVEFESEENCAAVKEAMEDCEIDGSKVTVAYAKCKGETGRKGARGGLMRGVPVDSLQVRELAEGDVAAAEGDVAAAEGDVAAEV